MTILLPAIGKFFPVNYFDDPTQMQKLLSLLTNAMKTDFKSRLGPKLR